MATNSSDQRLSGFRTATRILLTVLLISLSAVGVGLFASDTDLLADSYAANEVLVVFSAQYAPTREGFDKEALSFGIAALDSILGELGCDRVSKAIPFDRERRGGLRRLERLYGIHYDGDYDPAVVAEQLEVLPYFESARVNTLVQFTLHGTNRFVPGDTTEFDKQWNLDSARDSIDIDAPEAWAITRGDPSLVVGIIDAGAMLDTTSTPWKLHSDFNYHWIEQEDSQTAGEISWDDIDLDDDNSDGRDDNILGGNWRPAPKYTSGDSLGLWRSFPFNYVLDNPDLGVWDIRQSVPHGVFVSSIMSAALGGDNAVGIAHTSPIYSGRGGAGLVTVLFFVDMMDHMASIASVLNMSWGIREDYLSVDEDMREAMEEAATLHDCVLIASSGNEYSTTLVSWPANDPNVLGVGSIDSNLTWNSYSNAGGEGDIDVVAIGDYIWTDSLTVCSNITEELPDCDEPIEEKTGPTGKGTSFAAPQAAGVAALIRCQYPSLEQDEVRERVKNSSYFYWSDTSENRKKYGAGYINAYRAITEWGEIDEDTNWNPTDAKDSTFYVSGDLVIEDGKTLTINAGTRIKVAPDNERNMILGVDTNRVEIIVKGNLIIAGTSSNSVVFESFTDDTSEAGDWRGIKIVSSADSVDISYCEIRHAKWGIDIYADNVALDHVTVEDCDIGIWNHADDVELTDVTVSDCDDGIRSLGDLTASDLTVADCVTLGLWVAKDTATLTDCTFSGSGYGVYVSRDTVTASPLATMRGCTIVGHDNYGIQAVNDSDSIAVVDCTLRDSYAGIYVSNGAGAFVDSCTINSNTFGVSAYDVSNVAVTDCVIDSNTTAGVYCLPDGDIAFSANTARYNGFGVYCITSDPTIDSLNVLTYNGAAIKADNYAYPTIRGNTISYNTHGVLAINDADPDLGDCSCGTCTGGSGEGKNDLVGNTGYHVSNFTEGLTVMAECNYWGKSTGPKASKIYGSVDYIPYADTTQQSGAPPGGKEEPSDPDIPARYALHQNEPNPFNPTTTIRYDVPNPGAHVAIAVYDVQGKLVRTLFDDHRPPGFYSVPWNGETNQRTRAASGVYFVQMKSGPFVQTRKIVLLK